MYKLSKRLLDITVSLITLIFLLPIFVPIIIILRLSAEGEIFYFQERYGIHNSRFKIWKFATMLKNSMNIGTGSITLQNDPRVTKIGSFLRKTKIAAQLSAQLAAALLWKLRTSVNCRAVVNCLAFRHSFSFFSLHHWPPSMRHCQPWYGRFYFVSGL